MTVTPVSDPCVGNLATPVNSGYFMKGLITNLPFYRPGISPNFRGLETGAAFGYLLFGPFTICGPLRNTEYQQTAGLLAAIGAVHILTLLFLLYNQPGKQPNIRPRMPPLPTRHPICSPGQVGLISPAASGLAAVEVPCSHGSSAAPFTFRNCSKSRQAFGASVDRPDPTLSPSHLVDPLQQRQLLRGIFIV